MLHKHLENRIQFLLYGWLDIFALLHKLLNIWIQIFALSLVGKIFESLAVHQLRVQCRDQHFVLCNITMCD